MKVRVRTSDTNDINWIIEVWHWWWPVWRFHDSWTDYDTAVKFARRMLHPDITEIK